MARARTGKRRSRRKGSITMRQARRNAGGLQAIQPATPKAVPNRDGDFADFAEQFAATIAKDPARYHLSSEDSQVLTQRAREFRKAYNLAIGHDTRTAYTIGEKKAARKTAEQLIRAHMNLIRVDQSIARGDKIILNIRERPKRLKRTVCPESPPVLKYLYTIDASGSRVGRHKLEFAEPFTAGTARPRNAARMELFVELVPVGGPDDVPKHPCDLSGRPWYLRSFTSSPIEVEFPVPMSGPMLVVYWGRWADSKGSVGPFSETCVARVEGWNATNAKSLPCAAGAVAASGGGAEIQHIQQWQHVELSYVILQTPYALPAAPVKQVKAMPALPDQLADDVSRQLEAAKGFDSDTAPGRGSETTLSHCAHASKP